MSNYNDLLKAIKEVVNGSLNAADLSNLCIGKVVSAKPLKVMINQQLTIDKSNLIVPQSLTDYKVDIEIKDIDLPDDLGKFTIKKKCEFKNALKKDENVVLIKSQGGQQYLIIDRVV